MNQGNLIRPPGTPSHSMGEGDRSGWAHSCRRMAASARKSPQGLCREGGDRSVEYLIYIAVLAVIMAVAFGAFYKSLDNFRALNRVAEDTLRVLRVGEVWRGDIREAIRPPVVITDGELTVCEIYKRQIRIAYAFSQGSVWRQEGEGRPGSSASREELEDDAGRREGR